MRDIFRVYAFLGWFGLFYKVLCLGMFEVAILRLNNNRGVNQYGRCCSGARTTPPCTTQCRTYFSVCLMHSIQAMPLDPACTYGSARTGVFDRRNNIAAMNLYDSSSTMKIPINFTWPGRFTLLVESWHETASNMSGNDPSQLIIRSIISNFLHPSLTWRGKTTITPTTEIQYKYRLTCLPNFHGSGCDVMCRSRDDQFGHYTCSENGTRICKLGWNGTFCDKAHCSDECLQNNGFCERPYECRCPLGWQGPDCSQCERFSGCLNGICYEPYQCICRDGWGGLLCDIDLNYCSKSQPCLNGGSCQSNPVGNYSCLCPEKYKGNNCQIPLCYDGYCQNLGKCETHKWSRICTCTAEFYGDVCQHRKLNCNDTTCHNGGSCLTGAEGGVCECRPNTTGKFCETRIDACTSNPCDNGAKCTATDFGYQCKCLPNYAGRRCGYVINPCHNFKCHNGGRCLVKKGYSQPLCECSRNFSGDKCQISLDPCYNVKCLNGGTCRSSPMGNGFTCYCAEGFHGEFCEEIQDLCESSPCEHGAVCKNYVTSFLCICTSQYSGKRCEFEIMFSDINGNGSNVIYNTTDENLYITDSSVKFTYNRVITLFVCIKVLQSLFIHV